MGPPPVTIKPTYTKYLLCMDYNEDHNFHLGITHYKHSLTKGKQ